MAGESRAPQRGRGGRRLGCRLDKPAQSRDVRRAYSRHCQLVLNSPAERHSSGRSCRRKGHYHKRWGNYDSLPREIRDELKIARSSICAGCVRNQLRRDGLERTLKDLRPHRRYRREEVGREVWLVPEEELRP